AVGKRQRLPVRANTFEWSEPATIPPRPAQHRQRYIHGDHFGIAPTLLQAGGTAAGAAADVEHAPRLAVVIVEAFEQARFHFTLQRVVPFVGRGGARKRAAHLKRVEMLAGHVGAPASNGASAATTASACPMNGAWPPPAIQVNTPPHCAALHCMACQGTRRSRRPAIHALACFSCGRRVRKSLCSSTSMPSVSARTCGRNSLKVSARGLRRSACAQSLPSASSARKRSSVPS